MVKEKELLKAHEEYLKALGKTEEVLRKIFSNNNDFALDEESIKEWKTNRKLHALSEYNFKTLLKKYRNQKNTHS